MSIFDARGARLHVEDDLTYVYTPGELMLFPLVQNGIEGLRMEKNATGACKGMAFEFPDDRRVDVLGYLAKREGANFQLELLTVCLDGKSEVQAHVPVYGGKTLTSATLNEKASALLLKRKTELASGHLPVRLSETLTVDELLDSYIAQIENPSTQKRYRLSQRALSPQCGKCRITDVDAFTFDRFKDFRIKNGVTPAGTNRDIAVYRAAFNFGVERRLLVHSPLDGVKLFNEAKYRKPPRTVSFIEEQKILMCCDARLRTVVITLLETGMRVGIEALRLKWSEVDFAESMITVVQSKTAAGLRSLPMTAFVRSELLKWREATNGISEYVFFNPQRPSTHIQSVKKAWHNALKLTGLSRFPIYQCRHSFATRLAAAGVADTIIDQLLGHSRRDVLRFYTARVPEYLRDAIILLDKLRSAKTELAKASKIEVLEQTPAEARTLIN